ncbi:MAG: nucleotidyltransferase family protein [Methanosarcinales archaeon]|nr:nucleotidyltransferase family protein [Methanosarcinales archaeon]
MHQTGSEIIKRLKEKRNKILAIAAAHGARSVKVFGSAARGEARPDSDLDLLVEMEPGRSLLDIGRMVMDLQDLMGCKVDIVEPEGLHWYIREKILREAVSV